MQVPSRRKPNYAFIVAASCFIMIFVCLGFCSGTKSLFLAAITEALDIKRSLFSINDSCRYITTAVVNLFFGTLITRFGAKKLIGAGFLSLIISMLIYSFAGNVVVFCIGGCFLGMGLSWTTTAIVGYLVNRWFTENRGTIMGIILSANGLGGALASQVVTPFIYSDANLFGYRSAYLVITGILFITGIIVMCTIKDAPADRSEGLTKKKPKNKSWSGISFRTALHKPYFYIACICIFLTGMTLQGISGISSAHMKDVGLDASFIAIIVSAHSLALTGFKLLTGVLYDKLGLKRTLLICYSAAVISITLLALVTASAAGNVMAIIYGILSSLAMPLETIMLPLIATDLFGETDYSKLLGIVLSINTSGYALGAPLLNLIYDISGTYQYALFFLAALFILIACVFMLVLHMAKKQRLALSAEH
ncbi:MAG: MFS transporter [Ruminococcaceae bacterium]|nr:MFS transporter [Oscillospiraceae bacterium]